MQLKMKLNTWGGKRKRSGRSRIHSPGVAHVTREKVTKRTPVHVNFRYRKTIRNKETLKLLKRSIKNARSHGLRVLQFSFQSNHVHLILEAPDNQILTRGMRSLTITLAKGLNCGRVQVGRYHLNVLKSVREVKHALHYVLFNQQRHESGTCTAIDEYSSLLSLSYGLELVRKFASEKRLEIFVRRGEFWRPDPGESYLMKLGLTAVRS